MDPVKCTPYIFRIHTICMNMEKEEYRFIVLDNFLAESPWRTSRDKYRVILAPSVAKRNVAAYEAHWALDPSDEMLIILVINKYIVQQESLIKSLL